MKTLRSISNSSSGSNNKLNSSSTTLGKEKTKRPLSRDSEQELSFEKHKYRNSISNSLNQSKISSASNSNQKSNKKKQEDQGINIMRRGTMIPLLNSLTNLNKQFDIELNDPMIKSTKTNLLESKSDFSQPNPIRRNTTVINRRIDILNETMKTEPEEKTKRKSISVNESINNTILSEKKRVSKRLSQILEPEKITYQGLDMKMISNSSHRRKRKSTFFNEKSENSSVDSNSLTKKKKHHRKSNFNTEGFYYDENGNLIYMDEEMRKRMEEENKKNKKKKIELLENKMKEMKELKKKKKRKKEEEF